MSKAAFGTVNVPWSITPEVNYDVVLDGITVSNGAETVTLDDENGKRIAEIVYGDENAEITLTGTVKGINFLGQATLVGTMISNITDTDVPEPLIIVANELVKEKNGWSTFSCTCHYFGTDVTSGSATSVIGIATTTTTTAA